MVVKTKCKNVTGRFRYYKTFHWTLEYSDVNQLRNIRIFIAPCAFSSQGALKCAMRFFNHGSSLWLPWFYETRTALVHVVATFLEKSEKNQEINEATYPVRPGFCIVISHFSPFHAELCGALNDVPAVRHRRMPQKEPLYIHFKYKCDLAATLRHFEGKRFLFSQMRVCLRVCVRVCVCVRARACMCVCVILPEKKKITHELRF